jgi:hypothetical protein
MFTSANRMRTISSATGFGLILLFLVAPAAHAQIEMCLGQTATIIGTDADEPLNGSPGMT